MTNVGYDDAITRPMLVMMMR